MFLLTVLLVHAAVLSALWALSMGLGRVPATPEDAPPVLEARIILQKNTKDTVPLPDIPVHLAEPVTTALEMVRFDDDSTDISGIIGSVSSPELARSQIADVRTYAQRAGLTAGHSVTVLFVLEILPDGSVGALTLLRGSGNREVDDAAIAYARLLRWKPGTVNHQARVMRVTQPVTLANPA